MDGCCPLETTSYITSTPGTTARECSPCHPHYAATCDKAGRVIYTKAYLKLKGAFIWTCVKSGLSHM